MELEFDLKHYKFKCQKCGNCCYNLLQESDRDFYGFDFRGNYILNPTTSLSVAYTEVPELKLNVKQRYHLTFKLVPQEAIFLRDFAVGFIYQYQMAVKKKKYCYYYDLQQRRCKIYDARPAACRHYPIVFNPYNLSFPTVDQSCTAIDQELRRQHPSLKNGIPMRINNIDMIKAFLPQYLIYQNIQNFIISVLLSVEKHLGFLFLEDNTFTSEDIKEYEFLDFSQLFDWIRVHISDKNIQDKVDIAEQEFNTLQKAILHDILSWNRDPHFFQVPIRFWR